MRRGLWKPVWESQKRQLQCCNRKETATHGALSLWDFAATTKTTNYKDNFTRRHVSTNASASWTTIPTNQDARELFRLMDHRPGSVLEGVEECQKYNQDWTKQYQGNSSIVVRPRSTLEVSSILKYCNDHRMGVVPQGGNTGLVGGSVPIQQEIVLSLEQMNQIENYSGGILKVESGCIVQSLQEHLASSVNNALLPIDLGSKGTCQIGGTVSTNAGGSYYYRYGSFHANVLGLEVVLPKDGQVLDLGYTECHLKDNTGYPLRHLFIGAEGTLGAVTKVALKCPPLPKSKCAAFLACTSFQDVERLLSHAKNYLSEILAAFEYMDENVLKLVAKTYPDLPLLGDSTSHPYCILVETHGSNESHDQEKIQSFVETAIENGIVVDGILAQSLTQVQDMWAIREACNPAVAANGYVYKYDVSLSIQDFPDFIDQVQKQLPEAAINANWGHVVDGNLHCNVVLPGVFEKDSSFKDHIEGIVLDGVVGRGGSISAEHGLGQYKSQHMTKIKDPIVLSSMRAVKRLFDPNGIMNPGKYLPPKP